jgi:ankyrin repeat protein
MKIYNKIIVAGCLLSGTFGINGSLHGGSGVDFCGAGVLHGTGSGFREKGLLHGTPKLMWRDHRWNRAHWAVYYNNIDEMNAAIRENKDSLKSTEGEDRTPLILAADMRKPYMVEHLLRVNANVNAQDYNGRTALMAATANGDLKSMEMLIDAGADVNLGRPVFRDPLDRYSRHLVTDCNPLGIAIADIDVNAVKMLLEADAIVNGPVDEDIVFELIVQGQQARHGGGGLTPAQFANAHEIIELLKAKYDGQVWRRLYLD